MTTLPGSDSSLGAGDSRLVSFYTFEEFVVGPHNRFPHAASLAVSENLGKAYNPLFLYGPVGIGKTHLMQSVGHRVLQRDPKARVLYVTAQQFMTEVIDLLQAGKLQSFRERYRALDLLLVDDIQFLATSEATQEEFFHMFNDLHAAGKQIIMTSDRPPKMLTTLEDRLRSRFEWGLIADIKFTNLETRVAILRKKESHLTGMHLADDIRLYIASRLKSNIRELEGFLRRIQAYTQLYNETISLDLVKEILKELLPPEDWVADEPSAPSGDPSKLSAPTAKPGPMGMEGFDLQPSAAPAENPPSAAKTEPPPPEKTSIPEHIPQVGRERGSDTPPAPVVNHSPVSEPPAPVPLPKPPVPEPPPVAVPKPEVATPPPPVSIPKPPVSEPPAPVPVPKPEVVPPPPPVSMSKQPVSEPPAPVPVPKPEIAPPPPAVSMPEPPVSEPPAPVPVPKPPVPQPSPQVFMPKPPVSENPAPVPVPKPPVPTPSPQVFMPKPPVSEPPAPIAMPKPPVPSPTPQVFMPKPPPGPLPPRAMDVPPKPVAPQSLPKPTIPQTNLTPMAGSGRGNLSPAGIPANPGQIPVVFFYPAGHDKELVQMKRKFEDIINKHKLKFVLHPALEVDYTPSPTIQVELFVEKCAQAGVSIGVVLAPSPDTALQEGIFFSRLQEAFDQAQLSLQMVPWDELNKDYRFLNLALDITLIRIKQRKP